MNEDTTALGDCIEGFAKVKVSSIHCLPHIHRASHLIKQGRQVGQAQFILDKSNVAVPSHLLVLYVPGNGFQKKLHCGLPKNRSDGWLVCSSPRFPQSFEDKHNNCLFQALEMSLESHNFLTK